MKKFTPLLFLLFLVPLFMHAQRVEITAFGGYVLPARMNGIDGYVRFEGNGQYGGMISIALSRVMDMELVYTRSDTKAGLNLYNSPYEEIPLSINYIQVGVTKNFRVNPTISPFVGYNMGACVMAPKQDYHDVWFFAISLNGGTKIYLGKRIGFRVQANLYFPIQGAGFNMFVGSGGPSGGVSLNGTMAQFGIHGGLILRLGRVYD